MLSGPQMLMKSFGIDPEEVLKNVKEFGGAMLEIQKGISRIEANQARIMLKLEIPVIVPEVKEQ